MSDEIGNMQIRTRSDGGDQIAVLSGEINLTSQPRMRSTLLSVIEQRPKRLIVDLAGVSYMDSSAVGTLVELKRHVEQAGGTLILAGMQPRVRTIFEITQLDKFIRIVADVDEARRI